MSNMLKWAENELLLAGYNKDDQEDGPNKWLAEGTLELLKVFANQGHSGASAPYAIALFEKLASWKPITPLTGADDEWQDVGEGTWQNRRDSAVFKEEDGQAYYIDGIIWYTNEIDEEGKEYKSYFTNVKSRVFIQFPWSQPEKPEYREWAED